MSKENEIEVRVTANVGSLERGMGQAAKSVEDGAKRMDGSLKEAGNSMSGVASVIQSSLVMMAGVIAAAFAAIVFKDVAEDAAKLTEESMDLGRAMGVSATEASVWIAVLDDIGASQGELTTASRALTMKLRENEEALNRMGLKTRDASGNLRPMNDLMLDAITVVNSYKEGIDRNAAAQEIFGRSVNGSSKLLQASAEKAEETKKKMAELGVIVGDADVKAWKDYDDASDDANLTMRALHTVIGRALLPVMAAWREMLIRIGPELVKVARVAMETFLGVIDLARMVKQAFVSVGSDIGAVAAAAALALRGDFSGAMNVFKMRAADAVRETQKLKDLWSGTGDSFLGKFRQKFTASAAPSGDGKDFVSPKDKPDNKGKKGKNGKAAAAEKFRTEKENIAAILNARLAAIDAEESAARHAVAMDKATKATLLQQEIQFENQRAEAKRAALNAELAMVLKTTKDPSDQAKIHGAIEKAEEQHQANLTAIHNKAEVEDYNRSKQLSAIKIQSKADTAMAGVDAEQRAADQEFSLGLINKQQLLTLEAEFEQRRNQIKQDALTARLSLIDPDNDPVAYAAAKGQIEELERQHQARMIEIKNGAELERSQFQLQAMAGIEQALSSSIQKLITGQTTLAGFFKSVWKGALNSVAGAFANMAAKNIATMLSQAAAGKAIRLKEIMGNAYAAAAGAYKAIVGIPYVGPFLAPAAAAVAFGAVAAFGASAAGGYDIPAGVNPVTQLHAQEMVLPAKHADVIRKLADDGGGGGKQPTVNNYNNNVTIEVNTPNADSFRASGDQIMAELQSRLNSLRGT
jgi:hypothetical protein